jgi:alcohol dehydrogenase class IV
LSDDFKINDPFLNIASSWMNVNAGFFEVSRFEMWFFRSPKIVFGEDALSYLEQIQGKRAFIVTDRIMESLGFVKIIESHLTVAEIQTACFEQVEPEPSLETVHACTEEMRLNEPDWVIGLGGGSCLDASKVAWFLYERPDVDPRAINPIEDFGLRARARLITIPTTAGSGSEVSQAAMIRDQADRRKLYMASYEIIPDLTIVDPLLSAHMPPQLTADSGIDVLTHAREGYNNLWSNDFVDGLCMQAIRIVFNYLPKAVEFGAEDMEARQKMANAATIAGLAIANSNIALAHTLGHSVGGVFEGIPHGRVTAILLPGVIEYYANGGVSRYRDIAAMLNLSADNESLSVRNLSWAIRQLMQSIGLPTSLDAAGIPGHEFEAQMDAMIERAEVDLGILVSRRVPDDRDLKKLFDCGYQGSLVDF